MIMKPLCFPHDKKAFAVKPCNGGVIEKNKIAGLSFERWRWLDRQAQDTKSMLGPTCKLLSGCVYSVSDAGARSKIKRSFSFILLFSHLATSLIFHELSNGLAIKLLVYNIICRIDAA